MIEDARSIIPRLNRYRQKTPNDTLVKRRGRLPPIARRRSDCGRRRRGTQSHLAVNPAPLGQSQRVNARMGILI
jgi:hypothetical protein